MPFGDKTGPNGMGPRTGRGLGYCSRFNSPGFTKGTPRGGRGFGRGFGRGRGPGFGRGYRNRYYPRGPRFYSASEDYPTQKTQSQQTRPQLTKEEEVRALKDEERAIESEIEELKSGLEEIKERIKDLESE